MTPSEVKSLLTDLIGIEVTISFEGVNDETTNYDGILEVVTDNYITLKNKNEHTRLPYLNYTITQVVYTK